MRALAPEVLLSRPVQTFSAACLAPDRRLSTPTVGSGAGFVAGTTMADFTASAAARTALLQRAGWNAR